LTITIRTDSDGRGGKAKQREDTPNLPSKHTETALQVDELEVAAIAPETDWLGDELDLGALSHALDTEATTSMDDQTEMFDFQATLACAIDALFKELLEPFTKFFTLLSSAANLRQSAHPNRPFDFNAAVDVIEEDFFCEILQPVITFCAVLYAAKRKRREH
jgi:hypothetical protein